VTDTQVAANNALPSAYGTSHIKRRRSTKVEVENRREGLIDIVSAMKPMTVRQVFYQATVSNLVDKTEAGYRQVQSDLVLLRRDGVMPYRWLADNTRWQRKRNTFRSVEAALTETARFYRKDLRADADCYIEVWLEKDALSGVIYPITSMYDVPLMVARGYASLSFLHGAAEYINELEAPAYIYHLGDFDPSGVNAGEKIEEDLRAMAPDAEIHFERIGVTEEQIEHWNLPTRPTKASDTRPRTSATYPSNSTPSNPTGLRRMVECAIEKHLPPERFEVLKAAEESEREILHKLVAGPTAVGRA
jgi:hypothetical protein